MVTEQNSSFPVINCQLSIVNCQLIRTFVFKLKKYEQRIPPNRRSDCRHAENRGLIYNIEVDDEKNVRIDMTLTAPNCPAADFILEDVRMKIESVDGVNNVEVNLVFEPEWDKEMMSEEAKLELGFL